MSFVKAIVDQLLAQLSDGLGITRSAALANELHTLLVDRKVPDDVAIPALLAVAAMHVEESKFDEIRTRPQLVAAAFVDMLADGKNLVAFASQVLAVVMRQHNIAELLVTCPEMTPVEEKTRVVVMGDGTVEPRIDAKGQA